MIYNQLKNIVKDGCNKIAPNIVDEIGKVKEFKKQHLYALSFECFKDIEVVYNNIDIDAYSQSAAALRNAIEHFAILKIITDNLDLLDKYDKFVQRRFATMVDNHVLSKDDANKQVETLYSKRKNKQTHRQNFIDYGWMEDLTDKPLNIEVLIELTGLDNLTEWHRYLNKYVHHALSFLQLNKKGIHVILHKIIYIAAWIYSYLISIYHNISGFDFIIDGVHYAMNYRPIFNTITQIHKEEERTHNFYI